MTSSDQAAGEMEDGEDEDEVDEEDGLSVSS